ERCWSLVDLFLHNYQVLIFFLLVLLLLNLNMNTKLFLAASRAKNILTFQKCYSAEFLQANSKSHLSAKINKEYLAKFCRQLEKLGILYYEVKRIFPWGTPNVYLEGCFVEFSFQSLDNDQDDRERCQKYANESGQTCLLINFGQEDIISFKIFHPKI
ncbi:hypothetical protein Anas_09761, partial [Armadillidium nasatum]